MSLLTRARPQGTPGRPTWEPKRPRRTRPRHTSAVIHLAILAGAGLMLYPLLWMLASSFKPEADIFTQPGLIPSEITTQNYEFGWTALGLPFSVFFLNSITIAILAVIGTLFSCSLAAYAFSRLQFPLRKLLFAVMLITIMLPFHVTLVPQYIMFNAAGWTNTYFPLVVPKFLAVEAFFIFLMVQFIRALPRTLDDAATVDGCSPFGVFWRIILPLMRPALAVAAVFTFIWTWNDFLGPLLYISDRALFPVPVALNAFLDSTGANNWGPMFAMSILSIVPLFFVFLFAQRQLINGIATTGLK